MASRTDQSLVILLLLFSSVDAEKESREIYPCNSDQDCQDLSRWQYPYPICDTGTCRCPANLSCTHVTISSMVWWEYNKFCGICDEMGSECTYNSDCPTVSICSIGYCLCKEPAANKNDMCRIDKVIPSVSLTTVWMILILSTTIIINKTIKSKRFRNRLRFWHNRRSRRRSSDPTIRSDGAYRNPDSNSKSAAYTISNTEFISTTEDPDLDWAIEFSLMDIGRQSRRNRVEIMEEPAPISDQNASPTTNIEMPPDDTVTLDISQNLTENTLQNSSQTFEPIIEQINVPELVNSAIAVSSSITLSQPENIPIPAELGACSSKNTTIEDKDNLAYENTIFEDDTLSNLNDGQLSRASSNSQASNQKRKLRLIPRQSYRRSGSPPQYVNQHLQNQSDSRM